MGTPTGVSLCQDQGGSLPANSSSPLRPHMRNQSFSRRISLWLGSSFTTTPRRRLETSHLCLKVNVGDGESVRSDRERSLSSHWASEKFSEYLIGKQFHIETDHKPLVPILSTESLDQLPPRVLRFRLRRMIFHYTIAHVPGKFLYTADTLSRAPLPCTTTHLEEITEFFIDSIVSQLPGNKDRL